MGWKCGRLFLGKWSRGKAADAYCAFVASFIAEHQIGSVVDLGCGDFEIGRRNALHVLRHIGIDVVPTLIESHCRKFSSASVQFVCLDVIEEPLPKGELCLIRQVFQHLSNNEISRILEKLGKFRYLLITEHQLPLDGCTPNKDKPHGPDTRILDDSAVVLSAPPFSLSNITSVLSIKAEHYLISAHENIVTYCWTPSP